MFTLNIFAIAQFEVQSKKIFCDSKFHLLARLFDRRFSVTKQSLAVKFAHLAPTWVLHAQIISTH